jgi:hypothetical protein
MPRQLKEINNFNLGIVLNASEKDAPEDSATFSLNINPVATNGILDAINNDKLIIDIGENVTSLVGPVSWERTDNNQVSLKGYNLSNLEVNDIDVFQNQSVVSTSFLGNLGHKEDVLAYDIEPHWELSKVHVNKTVSWRTEEAFGATDDYITYFKAGVKATAVDCLNFTSYGVSGDATAEITITTAAGGSNSTIDVFCDVDETSMSGAGSNTIAIACSGQSDDQVTDLVVAAINGDDTNARVFFGSGVVIGEGIKGITASEGSATSKVTITFDSEGIAGNLTNFATHDAGGVDIVNTTTSTGGEGNLSPAYGKVIISDYNLISGGNIVLISTKNVTTTLTEASDGSQDFIATGNDATTATNLVNAINLTTDFTATKVDGSTQSVVTIHQVKEGDAGNTTIADNANGLTVVSFTGGLGVEAPDFYDVGDYLSFAATSGSPAFTGRLGFEIMQIASVDTSNYRYYLNRKCFGSTTTTLAANTAYHVYSNKFTVDNLQQKTQRASFKIQGWSGHGGNNIGDSSLHFYRAGTGSKPAQQNAGYTSNAGTTSAWNVVFGSASGEKIITFGTSYTGGLNAYIEEGEYFTVYTNVNYAAKYLNNGRTFKLLKKSANKEVWTVDVAPTFDTQDANQLFLESALVKNGTFAHYRNTADYNVTDGSAHTSIYKFNDWKHRHLRYIETGGSYKCENYYTDNDAETDQTPYAKVDRIASGGYWETAWVHGAQVNESGNYYPFQSNAKPYVTIEADYVRIEMTVGIAMSIADTKFTSNLTISTQLASDDIIKIDNEYMRVESIDDKIVVVERGLYNSDVVGHDIADNIYRTINHLVSQDISKDRLIKGQKYKLTFYAKGNANPYTERGFISLRINGGYFDIGGTWQESSQDWGNGFFFGSGSQVSPDIMQEQRWLDFNQLFMPDGDTPLVTAGTESESKLDDVWRKFQFHFELPPRLELTTDLSLEFSSRGPEGTKYGLDMVRLEQDISLSFDNKNMSSISTSALLDNGDSKDLVIYDKTKGKISAILGFSTTGTSSFSILDTLAKSATAASTISSSIGTAVMAPKNREMHMGFGGGKGDTSPQWLGYVNHKVFGKDYTNELYQDEDTIPSYGGTTGSGGSSLDKICLAGEYEYCDADWDNGNTKLKIFLANYTFVLGDNIIVREWEDADNSWEGSGVWCVTEATDAAFFYCRRDTTQDKNPSDNNFMSLSSAGTRDDNDGRVCVRPYYYYGCKEGEPYLYRITPSARLSSDPPSVATGEVYKAGIVERSGVLTTPIHSICTYYNKNSTGVDGGRIYALSSITEEVLVLGVDVPYNEWKIGTPSVHATMQLEMRAHNWSNESITGNITRGGYTQGPALWGLSPITAECAPIIVYSGILSDILETKGPTSDCDNLYTINNTTASNAPINFDTRLWIQSRPPAEGDTFTANSRFLFCAKTEEDNTESSTTLYCADRSPTMMKAVGVEYMYRYTSPYSKFAAGPGADAYSGDWHGPSPEGHSYHLHYYSYFWIWIWQQGHTAAPANDYLESLSACYNSHNHPSYSHAMYGQYRSVPYVNFGDNVGWKGDYQHDVTINVAKFGLFAISDNDCDGVLDGTGIVVPSNLSILDTTYKSGPYGNLGQRVLSHAVGLVGAGLQRWSRNFGKMHASDSQFFHHEHGDHISNTPEHVNMEKCIFVCPDIHAGEPHIRENSYSIASVADGGSDKTWLVLASTYNLATQGADSRMFDFQAGDPVYIAISSGFAGTDWGGQNQSTVIERVDITNNRLLVPLKPPTGPTGVGTLYGMSVTTRSDGVSLFGNTIGGSEPMWHHAWWSYNPNDGALHSSAANSEAWRHTRITKHFYSPPSYIATGGKEAYAGEDSVASPGYCFPIEKLNFRAGTMIRPFNIEDEDFEDFIIGNGIHVDIPSMPDTIYHKKPSGNFKHYSINDANVHNQFASKMFLTSPVPSTGVETEETSKVYLCDLNFMYPTESTHITVNPTVGSYNADELSISHWDAYLGGTAIVSYSDSVGDLGGAIADTYYFRNVAESPVVEVAVGAADLEIRNVFSTGSNYRKVNFLVGMCLTIVDAVTGTMQTRYIIQSKRKEANPAVHTSAATGNMFLQVHYPFQHAPDTADNWFIWKQGNCVTSPIRLYKEKELTHNLGTALIADPIIQKPLFKDSGFSITDGVDSSGTLCTFQTGLSGTTTTVNHNLSTNDIIRVKNATNTLLDDVYTITVTSPTKFTFAHTLSENDNEAEWELLEDSLSTVSNPLTINMAQPILKSTFGGLDMRKLKKYTVPTVIDDTNDITITSTAHLLLDGNTISFKSEIITAEVDRLINGASNWTEHSPSGSAPGSFDADGSSGVQNISFVQLADADAQGATLGTGNLELIASPRVYRITAELWTSSGTLTNVSMGIGGTTSSTFSINTNKLLYIKELAAGSDAALIISSTHNGAITWNIDNISVEDITQNAIYVVKNKATDTIDAANPEFIDLVGELHTNQFESLIAATSGTMHMGELRNTFNNWDRGNIAGNVMRYDRDTIGDPNIYMNISESAVVISSNSLGDQTDDFFQKNTDYYYRISLIYDGYQEGPLSNAIWTFNSTKTRALLSITVKISQPSRRLSHVCVYRKDNIADNFKLVKQVPTSGGWRRDAETYRYVIGDDGAVGASYEARTGLSEVLDTIKVKYGLSKEIDGYLFVGDCSHERIENASNMLFRSRPGMFSIFDYANDFQTLKSKPTALTNFNGRLYAFDSSNIYRINQHDLTIEDIYEGIGCLGKDSIAVTEYGMFFADRNGAYLHSGSAPQRISEPIHIGGDLTKFEDVGSDNIYDLSWVNTVGSNLYNPPMVVFDADTSSVLFIVDFTTARLKSKEHQSYAKSFIWSFNITNKRWDLWELAEDKEIGTPFLGVEGEVLIPIGSSIYHNRGSHSKRAYTWVSKKMTMGEDSIVKVFNKVKLNGSEDNLVLGGSNLESSDRLLLATSTGAIATSDIIHTTSNTGYSSYKIKGSNKKGRWLQLKLEDMTKPVDSLGVIFRRKSTK